MIEGTWTLEGHSVSYEQGGDVVVIRETVSHPTREPHNSHTTTSLKNATEHQNRYIKLGYDKVS
jgi:hypothetical protein|tara:strand:- start:365 stop:556 length:192 start_codon:yes stop_codon:yes gene_type:complete